jgi:hypothetical protein
MTTILPRGRRIRVAFTAVQPICHGAFDSDGGNAILFHRQPRVVDGAVVLCPAVTANSQRGQLRRLIMRDMLDRCGLTPDTVPERVWDVLYLTLCNGGALQTQETRVVPADVRKLRAAIPPLSLFGASVLNGMIAGHLQPGPAWLDCADIGTGPIPAADLATDHGMVRHLDGDAADGSVLGLTPMPLTIEAVIAGATFRAEYVITGSELEASIVAHGLDLLQRLGGKGASGFGQVTVQHDGTGDLWRAWLDEHVDELRASLQGFADHLHALVAPAKAKKGKAAA